MVAVFVPVYPTPVGLAVIVYSASAITAVVFKILTSPVNKLTVIPAGNAFVPVQARKQRP
jgi:hypothetical protein